ncbi:MAG: Ferrichrome outer membrane transporter/phage receptor [Herbaspirillum frisingense]|uniref:Ferrichrome outer membrane transporter/phage receptor n=1 Tax=Herbaspirillum frisingense TaxID=92645 RepID=A0A7V8JU88_9BURK|nr:MAG: Ferrichrome outer membrane transporter/phage receptor [Herbaspirillum frisingense]
MRHTSPTSRSSFHPAQPRPRTLALAVHLAALGLLAAPAVQAQQAAQAQAASRSYSIAAGPLGQALRQFAAEAGILLSADARLTQGKASSGVRGNVSVQQGFERLLSGSGLSAVRQPDGGYIVINAATTGASADGQLPQVKVVAAPTGEADGTYRAVPNASTLRGAASPLEVPQIVNVVPAQVIKDQRPRNLDDAVGAISGLTQGNTLASTQDTIMKRGFGGNRDGSVMRNGMPLVQGRAFNATAESVEVLKGPSSLLYGLMDPGGVINIITKKPQLTQRNEISFAGSTYGDGKNGGQLTLDSTGPIGDAGLAYRLIIDRTDQNYWRNYGQIQETVVAPSLAWYGRDTQIVFQMEQREFLYPFDRGTAIDSRTNRPLAIPPERRLDEPGNDMKGSSETTQLTIDHRINQDWKAHVGLSYNREVYDARQLRVAGVNPVTGVVTRSNDGTRGSLSTDTYAIAYAEGRVDLGGLRHDVQLGADIEYRKIHRADLLRGAASSTSFNFLNPVYGQTQPASLVSASDSNQTDLLHNKSLFVQDALHLGDRWIVVGGLRYQDYSQLAGRGRPFKANTDLSGDKWLPRAGLIYKLDQQVSLYASYSKSLKPTSTIAPLASGVVIDSDVAPEEASSWEGGVKYDNPQGLSGTLAVFNIKKKNVLVSQFNAGTGLTDWRTSGAARSRGVELDVTGQLSRRLSMIGSYAYLDAKTTDDPLYAGLRLWNVARQTAALTLAYDVGPITGGDKLRVGGGGRYVGERPGDSANSFMLPSYTVADAFATYDTTIGGKAVKFQFNIKNLFNKTYYTSSANQYFVSMGDARQFSLLTSLEF